MWLCLALGTWLLRYMPIYLLYAYNKCKISRYFKIFQLSRTASLKRQQNEHFYHYIIGLRKVGEGVKIWSDMLLETQASRKNSAGWWIFRWLCSNPPLTVKKPQTVYWYESTVFILFYFKKGLFNHFLITVPIVCKVLYLTLCCRPF